MQSSKLPDTLHRSPKRKRLDPPVNTHPSPSPLKISNILVRPSMENSPVGEGNPQAALVARHLQNLELEEQTLVPILDVEKGVKKSVTPYRECDINHNTNNQISSFDSDRSNIPITTYESSPGAMPKEIAIPDPPPEVPETPPLKPTVSPLPLPSRPQSPPLPLSALWWKETEITGHDPKDPLDDGYGINGVGFLPTPAIANARAERRKRQILEWRNREAKEARQKRSDRRRRRDMANEGLGSLGSGLTGREVRKVRFVET